VGGGFGVDVEAGGRFEDFGFVFQFGDDGGQARGLDLGSAREMCYVGGIIRGGLYAIFCEAGVVGDGFCAFFYVFEEAGVGSSEFGVEGFDYIAPPLPC
jgi:hypothetical protein